MDHQSKGTAMGAQKGIVAANGRSNGQIGLLANGSSGRWDVAIDQTIAGKDRWFAHVEGPSICCYFEISSPRIVADAIAYLDQGNNRPARPAGSLLIGCDKHIPVSLIRDDEFADRVFLVVGPDSAPIVRCTISGADIGNIVAAMRQVQEDLES
jgi:hypothetical protein